MILRPFLYDVRKTLTSKTVLILVGIILLISLTIIPLTTVSVTSISANPPSVLYYHDGGYHFLAYAYNQYGDPLDGVRLNITLGKNLNLTQAVSQIGLTNSSGLIYITFASTQNYTSVQIQFASNGIQGVGQGSTTTFLPDTLPGLVQPLNSPNLSLVQDKADTSKRDVQVFYAIKNGAKPIGYQLYFKLVNSTGPYYQSNPFNRTEMTYLGTMNTYQQVFNPTLPAGNDSSQVWFELFPPNNNTSVQYMETTYTSLRIPSTPINETGIATFFFSGVLSFFIPLMAIIGSYSSYGKDRLTGVLESILARPVTRRGLAVSRFLSNMLAMGIAVITAVVAVDAILNYRGGSLLSQQYVLAVVGALLVELAAFTGIMFLLSHLVKSTGALLGIGIGLFVVLYFFFSLIIYLVTVLLGGTSGSAVAIQATILSQFANPTQFISLVNIYYFASASGTLIQPSTYGLTLPALVLDGVLWAIVPFLAFFYLAVKRD